MAEAEDDGHEQKGRDRGEEDQDDENFIHRIVEDVPVLTFRNN